MGGLSGFIDGLFFFVYFLFDLLRQASICLEKCHIYCELCYKVVRVTRLGKSFLTASVKFIIVV